MKIYNSKNSMNPKIFTLILALIFTTTTIACPTMFAQDGRRAWSAPDLYLRQKAALERHALDSHSENADIRGYIHTLERNADPSARIEAIRALGKSKNPTAIIVLANSLREGNTEVSNVAIDTLT